MAFLSFLTLDTLVFLGVFLVDSVVAALAGAAGAGAAFAAVFGAIVFREDLRMVI